MVRLNPNNPGLVGSSREDVQPQVVDELLSSGTVPGMSAHHHKRSRPKSSLDYKAPTDRSDTVLPQFPPEVTTRDADRYRNSRMPGGDASWDGASTEELSRRMADMVKGRVGDTSNKKKSRHDDRLDQLRNQGFPFMQWAILLLLLGYGLYRLYKLLKSPDKSGKLAKASSVIHGKKPKQGKEKLAPGGGGRGRGIGKGQPGKGKKSRSGSPSAASPTTTTTPKNSSKTTDDAVLNKVLAEIEGTEMTTQAENSTNNTKKPVTNKKKLRKPPKVKAVAASTPSAKNKDGDSSSTASTPPASHEGSAGAALNPATAELADLGGSDEADGGAWQTVGVKSGSGSGAESSNNVNGEKENVSSDVEIKPTNGSSSPETAAPAAPTTTSTTATIKAEDKPQAVPEEPNNKKKSKKKKKTTEKSASEEVLSKSSEKQPRQPASSIATEVAASTATDSDEALAIRLQEEENNLGSGNTNEATDEWAPVSNKKKKVKADDA